jgi:hypothetical protein
MPNDFDAFSIKKTSSFVDMNKFRFSHRVKRGDSHEVTNPTLLNINKKVKAHEYATHKYTRHRMDHDNAGQP